MTPAQEKNNFNPILRSNLRSDYLSKKLEAMVRNRREYTAYFGGMVGLDLPMSMLRLITNVDHRLETSTAHMFGKLAGEAIPPEKRLEAATARVKKMAAAELPASFESRAKIMTKRYELIQQARQRAPQPATPGNGGI